MKKKWFVVSIILITIINLSAFGTYIYNRWRHSKIIYCSSTDTASHGCYMKRCLGISDEQASNLDVLEKTYKPKVEALSSMMKEKRIELVKELMKEKPDSMRIRQILREVDSLQAQMQREVVERLIEEKRILTPEQQEKFFSLVLGKFYNEKDSIIHSGCQK